MSDRNKVIWSEGLFLRPQHFQQQERYFERYVEGRTASLRPWSWGFEELELDRDHLAIGKLAVKRAKGVFPDGTPFSIPDHDPAPQPLEISADARTLVFLALPLRRSGALDSDRRPQADPIARQIVREIDVRDVTKETATTETVEVGGLRTRLIAEGNSTEDFSCIPMACIEGRRGTEIRLDDAFMPTCLRIKACPPLESFLREYLGMLTQRLDAFLLIVGGGGRGGGVGEIADFLKLQAISRYEPLLRHFAESPALHPEDFYRWAVVIAGDFAALTTEKRRASVLPPYQHEDFRATFRELISALRTYTPDPAPSRAASIAFELKRPNFYMARILDPTLIDSAKFILAVRADLPDRQVERTFPQLATLSPVTRLNEILKRHEPGLLLSTLPQIPPHIPFRTNHVYFEVASTSSLWSDMKGSGAFGLYVPDGFPNLQLEMWAIRIR